LHRREDDGAVPDRYVDVIAFAKTETLSHLGGDDDPSQPIDLAFDTRGHARHRPLARTTMFENPLGSG
jgi:hypothetical protein